MPSPGQGADIRFLVGRSGFSAQFNYAGVSQPFTVDTAFMFDYYNQLNSFFPCKLRLRNSGSHDDRHRPLCCTKSSSIKTSIYCRVCVCAADKY